MSLRPRLLATPSRSRRETYAFGTAALLSWMLAFGISDPTCAQAAEVSGTVGGAHHVADGLVVLTLAIIGVIVWKRTFRRIIARHTSRLCRELEERKRVEEELKEREKHAQSLLRLSRCLERAQTYSDVMNAAQDEVRTIAGYKNLWAYLLPPGKEYAHALFARGPLADMVMGGEGIATLTIKGDRMLEEIAEAREIVLVEDARTDPRTNKEIVARLGNRTIVNVPIILFDRHMGSVGMGTFGDEGVRIPTGAEQEYLRALASQLAVTFDRIHLLIERARVEAEILQLNRDLEQRVAQRTADLELAVKELEAFSYSVSHDLRVPLRAVDGFSRILQEDYMGALDADGQRFLGLVRQGAIRMDRLIDDILAFSRTSRGQMGLVTVDMTALAKEVYAELQSAVPGRNISFVLGDLPPARCDRAMLRQVLTNLLSNAIKYSRLRAQAVIEVSGTAGEVETVYRVKDNGAGFDMQYADKLFGVFQRLHSAEEFEGTGIGLAIVKRIVERHGGHVWAESKVDEGAALYFALPRG